MTVRDFSTSEELKYSEPLGSCPLQSFPLKLRIAESVCCGVKLPGIAE